MSAKIFCCFQIQKENRTAGSFSFQFETTKKNFNWNLVLSVWFLVTGRSNEKNISALSTFRRILIIKTPAWNDRNMKRFKCIHCNICSIHYKRVNIAKKDATYFLGKKVLEGFIWEMHKKEIFVQWNGFNFIMKWKYFQVQLSFSNYIDRYSKHDNYY